MGSVLAVSLPRGECARREGKGIVDWDSLIVVCPVGPPFLSMGFEDESHPPLPLIRLVSYLLDIPKPGATNPLPLLKQRRSLSQRVGKPSNS